MIPVVCWTSSARTSDSDAIGTRKRGRPVERGRVKGTAMEDGCVCVCVCARIDGLDEVGLSFDVLLVAMRQACRGIVRESMGKIEPLLGRAVVSEDGRVC